MPQKTGGIEIVNHVLFAAIEELGYANETATRFNISYSYFVSNAEFLQESQI